MTYGLDLAPTRSVGAADLVPTQSVGTSRASERRTS